MNPFRKAAIALVAAIFMFVAGGFTTLHKNPGYSPGPCQESNVQAEANRIAAARKPQARQFDSASGTEYLRYRRNIVKVSPTGPTGCSVEVENLDHYNSGTYIFLGPGFSPSSPSNSSGGSSGSSGGVK